MHICKYMKEETTAETQGGRRSGHWMQHALVVFRIGRMMTPSTFCRCSGNGRTSWSLDRPSVFAYDFSYWNAYIYSFLYNSKEYIILHYIEFLIRIRDLHFHFFCIANLKGQWHPHTRKYHYIFTSYFNGQVPTYIDILFLYHDRLVSCANMFSVRRLCVKAFVELSTSRLKVREVVYVRASSNLIYTANVRTIANNEQRGIVLLS